MRGWLVLGMGVAAAVATIAACGDDEMPPAAGPPDAGGTASDATPIEPRPSDDAGADASDGGAPYTLDDVCARTAEIICEIRRPCCAAYDAGGCIAFQKADCARDVAAVRAGEETFHPERIDTCFPTLKRLYAQCSFTWDLLQREGRNLDDCAIFVGKRAVDAGCERSAQCLPSASPDDLVSCDEKTKHCKIISFLAEGAPCALGDDIPNICSAGLYCDVDFGTFKGVCKKATSLGVACDKTKQPIQLECGLGNYCDLDSGKCTVGRPGGAACDDRDLECASLDCVHDAGGPDGGQCAPVAPLAKPAECTGL